jgi:hypothetical protein
MSAEAAVASSGTPTMSGGSRVVLPGQSPDGEYILSVLLKRTFTIVPGQVCVRATEDAGMNAGELFWDHPMNSSVKYESDFAPYKPATDVVLNGTVYAPDDRPATSCTVSLTVGDRRKVLEVVGDRQAKYAGGRPAMFTDPVPFRTMELRYERAYGGTDVYSDLKVPYPYPRNPLGRGFAVKCTARSVDNLPLPNIETPERRLTPERLCLGEYAAWESRPVPAGFGWYPKTWLPRAALAGVMPLDRPIEQEMRRVYADLLPGDQREPYLRHGFRDMDFAFFNGASEGMVFPFLSGGERVISEQLAPEGRLEFTLPSDRPRLGLDIGEGAQEPLVVLHTVMIRMDDREVDLVWRGAVHYRGPDWLPEMRRMDVLIEG